MNSNNMLQEPTSVTLVGDIGGTNARFALWREARLECVEVLACGDYPRREDAVRE